MKKLALLAIFIMPTISFACADQWSPDDWVLNPEEDVPIVGLAMSTEGSRHIDLNISREDDVIARFTLERPKDLHTWIFNSCQLNRRYAPLIFAVAHTPKGEYGRRWVSRLTAAYRINLKDKKLEAIGLKGVRCFVGR